MKEGKKAELWDLFEPLVLKWQGPARSTGRPRVNLKRVFEAVLWILKSGAPWRFIPEGIYPSYQTCHRYFQQWAKAGLFKKLFRKLRQHPDYGGDIKTQEMFYIDGSFAPAKKGALYKEKPRREKALRSWYLSMRKVSRLPSW
jgi:transposase